MLERHWRGSVEELFQSIPEQFRLREPLPLPGPLSETEIIHYFQARAAENSRGYTSFLGAGVYQHLRSVVTDALIQRGEFLTSYTPYQAEISQGTLTAIFEFQTLMCQLTGQEVANASMYDGSTALTEAVLMAERLTGRHRVLVARSVHPEYRQVLAHLREESGPAKSRKSATRSRGRSTAPRSRRRSLQRCGRRGGAVAEFLRRARGSAGARGSGARVRARCWSRRSPKPSRWGSCARRRKPTSWRWKGSRSALRRVTAGRIVGVIATREKFVRQMPGRLAGQTTDADGRRGFVLTLATREQHIRREKATSNICTNEALFALAATIHLCLLGKEGLARAGAAESGEGAFRAGRNWKRFPACGACSPARCSTNSCSNFRAR